MEPLSERVVRTVAQNHTVKWKGERWGVPHQDVCAGLRGARVEIERRLDGSHWLRFRGRYLPLESCPAAPPRSASPSGLQDLPIQDQNPKPKSKANTVLLSITLGNGHFYLAKTGHFYFALT